MKHFKNIIATNWVLLTTVLIVLMLALTFGCTKKEPEEIKIGVITALSGLGAKYGESAKKGIDLAIEEVNIKGGINGKKIQVFYEDYQTDTKLAVSSLQKLITINKIFIVLAATGSSEVLAIAPIAEKEQVILFASTASAPSISKSGDFIFRNVASDVYEGSIMANYARETLNARTVAVIFINNDFGLGLKDSFEKRFQDLGGIIVSEQFYNPEENDYRTQIAKIKNANPDVVYIVGFKEMGNLLKQAIEIGLKKQFLSFTMFEDPDILKISQKAAEGVHYSSQAFDPESNSDIVQTFARRFKEKYGIAPDVFSALNYDATRILILAIEKGGYSRIKVKESLYKIVDFAGVTGTTTIDSNGDAVKSVGIKKIKEGQFVWVERPH